MNLELSGKVAFISGSSRGIGLEIAKTLDAEGCKVIINGRNEERLADAIKELPTATAISADITDEEQSNRVISDVIKQFGKLDILICNVGSGDSVKPGDELFKDWQESFAINLWSATNLVEAARDYLALSNGSIVCISSICGLEVIPGAPLTYSAAKAALNSYIKGVSRPLGKMGVRINGVAPGNILHESSVWSDKIYQDEKSVKEMLEREVSLSSLGSKKDVANLVTYLVSSVSGFVSGSIWTIDGGQIRS